MKLQSIAIITADRPSARARKPPLTYYRYDEFDKKVDFEGGRASGIYDTYYKFARKVQFRGV